MNHVTALVLRLNNFDFPEGKTMGIPCGDNTVIESLYWRVPTSGGGCGGSQLGYKFNMYETKPRPDAVRTLRVRHESGQNTYYVALADGADATVFTDLCNACCDAVDSTMPAVTIPSTIFSEIGCADADGNYKYFSITQPLESGQNYLLSGSLNGEALPAAPDAGFASLAALATWANANWSPATVSVSGNKVTLTSATGTSGSISVTIKPA